MTDRTTPAKKAHSGSEKRQMTARFTVRCTAEQRLKLEENAARAGLTMSAYVLLATLNAPPTKSGRVAPLETQMIAQLLAQLGRLNGLVNQIAKRVNRNETVGMQEIAAAVAELPTFRAALREALGRQP